LRASASHVSIRDRMKNAIIRLVFVGLLVAPVAAVAADETPSPAPAPPASLDDLPSAKREDVTKLLRRVRQRHGDDAVVIQTNLLINAMQKGSVLATGVRVERVEEAHGTSYLGFALETGLVFDDATRDREQRGQILWATIMEPTLGRLQDGLQIKKAAGIVVKMQSFHRPYRSVDDLRATIDKPGASEEVRFYVRSADLDAVLHGELTLRALITRARTTVDGAEVTVAPPAADAVLTPGPD